ncbi:MAG: hypothetical protein KF903_13960 [Dokdonella sp.]|uniref:TfpX/TfpZ family type IV pilin accessory protein n=1 Tax=Dokdonella sp. TaxID=2291710 RepID=UPI0025BA1823|nr:TfpX/TfpZ family type IV pilin accessory protein [Dokdonella sp.]MBX3702092.1 hypothetical protein [Dokdonella sp.]
MSRWKAAGIHLSANAVIATLALALIFLVWYPHPYSQAAGAGMLALLLLGVDLVLGPLLTLVVYKAGKKSLRFDLTIIVMLQIAAFAYGLHVVAQARPAFIVGAVDRFVLVAANELAPTDIAKASNPRFNHVPWTGPLVVGAKLPSEASEVKALVFSGLAGKDVEKFPQYYVPYADVASALLARATPLDTFVRKHPTASAMIDAWRQAHPAQPADSVVALPLNSRTQAVTALVDRHTGAILDTLAFDPW